MTLNLAACIYMGQVKPWIPRIYNRVEMFNEVCIMFATFILVSFTDFGPDIENKFTMGWQIIGVISI